MGDFRIELNGIGAHGCQRVMKEGDAVVRMCGRNDCPDCWAIEIGKQFAAKFSPQHNNPQLRFTHWPGQKCEVVDETLFMTTTSGRMIPETVRRRGNF